MWTRQTNITSDCIESKRHVQVSGCSAEFDSLSACAPLRLLRIAKGKVKSLRRENWRLKMVDNFSRRVQNWMLIVVKRFGLVRAVCCASGKPKGFSLDVQAKEMRKIEQ